MTNANDSNHESVHKMANESVINRKTSIQSQQQNTSPAIEYNPQIRWPDLGAQLFLHSGAIYALVFLFYKIKLLTLLWCKYI